MLKGYKTIAFNLLASVVPLLELTEIKSIVPDDQMPLYLFVVAGVNLLLRYLTNTPVGKKA